TKRRLCSTRWLATSTSATSWQPGKLRTTEPVFSAEHVPPALPGVNSGRVGAVESRAGKATISDARLASGRPPVAVGTSVETSALEGRSIVAPSSAYAASRRASTTDTSQLPALTV